MKSQFTIIIAQQKLQIPYINWKICNNESLNRAIFWARWGFDNSCRCGLRKAYLLEVYCKNI